MKYKAEFDALVQHSHFLRSSMNLAYDRSRQLENTMQVLKLPSVPSDNETFTQLQVQAAQEIGGINTRMFLDAPEEIQKYHFGPLQVALSLLFAIIEKYRQLCNSHPIFQDDVLDQYCHENHQFVETLKTLRNSIVRQRYDNVDEQEKFVKEFSGDKSEHLVTLLIEGESVYRSYLSRLWHVLIKAVRNDN
ncbi:MAG: hypothetical protein F4Z35_01515 [Dehalococcoidia bacterium]|nr:hypothetical protein [Dehalococcoidia bacterium]